LPLVFHGGGRWGNASVGVRIGRPERRGIAVRRETHERRGLGVGAHVATAAGAVLMRAHRDVRARVKSRGRKRCTRRRRLSRAEWRGLCGLRSTMHP
jgi:hypothetical protein